MRQGKKGEEKEGLEEKEKVLSLGLWQRVVHLRRCTPLRQW